MGGDLGAESMAAAPCFTVCPFVFQVRKSSQDALLILLEQGLVFQHNTEHQLCPILPALSALDSDGEYKEKP